MNTVGEFLLVIINGRDPWLRYAFGPLLAHGGFRGVEWWTERVKESGLQVVESGTVRASFYLVGRRWGRREQVYSIHRGVGFSLLWA